MRCELPDPSSNKNSGHKRHYVTPELVRYGQVRDLTQSGTGKQAEFSIFNIFKNCSPTRSSIKACASDCRIKEDIVRIGEHPLGIGLYLFDYKPEFRDEWGHGRQFGVMAQEVERVMPQAVRVHPDGYKAVDYGMLGISRPCH